MVSAATAATAPSVRQQLQPLEPCWYNRVIGVMDSNCQLRAANCINLCSPVAPSLGATAHSAAKSSVPTAIHIRNDAICAPIRTTRQRTSNSKKQSTVISSAPIAVDMLVQTHMCAHLACTSSILLIKTRKVSLWCKSLKPHAWKLRLAAFSRCLNEMFMSEATQRTTSE
eukprot:12603-Heterococcus_DN1.PRE.2